MVGSFYNAFVDSQPENKFQINMKTKDFRSSPFISIEYSMRCVTLYENDTTLD